MPSIFKNPTYIRITDKIPRPIFITARNFWDFFKNHYGRFRLDKTVTGILGPRFVRSRKNIELDITYKCNLHCNNCNRSCAQALTSEAMTLEQVQRFIKESVEKGVVWGNIRLVGGEPTLHPQLKEIFDALLDYKHRYAPKLRIYLVTNGCGDFVNKRLENIPAEIIVENSAKKVGDSQLFLTFNEAPADMAKYQDTDYTNGCFVMQQCGMGLTPYGYYPCAVAGSIDRVFGYNVARKTLPDLKDDMNDHLNLFCRYCGLFKFEKRTTDEVMSPAWKTAYEKYKQKKPVMTYY